MNAGSTSTFLARMLEKPRVGAQKGLAAAAPNICLFFSVVAMLGAAALATYL